MKRYIIILFLFAISSVVLGQSHGVNETKNIIFYPVTEKVKKTVNGYDCFYDTQKTIKKGRIKFNAKNRLNPNSNYLTPYEEITNHSFYVNSTSIKTINKKSYYVAILVRDDGKDVALILPFEPTKNDNYVTKSMIRNTYEKTSGRKKGTGVDIPCIEIDLIDKLKELLIGKEIVRYYLDEKIPLERIDTWEISKYSADFSTHSTERRVDEYDDKVKKLNNNNKLSKEIILPGTKGLVTSLKMVDNNDFVFCQPALSVQCKDGVVYLPIKDLYGYYFNNNKQSHHLSSILSYYTRYDALLSVLKEEADIYQNTGIKKGDSFYYCFEENCPSRTENTYYLNNYDNCILKQGVYTYVDEGIFPSMNNSIKYSILIRDTKGELIVVPFFEFKRYFRPKSEIQSILDERRSLELKRQREKDMSYRTFASKIAQKYGITYSEYFLGLNDSDKEKFKKAISKWDAAIAKDIVEGYVHIGWSKEQCEMSWGEPRKVNRSIYSWGTNEQWCYRSSYLYFDNGKLTSIQQY